MGKVLKIAGGVLLALIVIAGLGWAAMRKPDIPYAKLEARYGNSQSRYVDLKGGYRVHYREQGKADGPPILLLHGYYVSLETWQPWVRELGADYRIITLDLPGHGLTRAPKGWPAGGLDYVQFVEAFARARNLEKFVLGGSSMGGGISWAYALAHPEQVRGLILVDSAGWRDTRPGHDKAPAGLESMRNPTMRFLLRDLDSTPRARTGLRSAYANPALMTDPMVNRYVEMSRAPGHRDAVIDLALNFRSLKPADAKTLGAITAPTLILWGAKDQLIPVDHGQKFAAAIPGSRLVIYPKVGHVPQEEVAAQSAAEVRSFMVSLEPKKAPPRPRTDKPAVDVKDPAALVFY